MSNANDLLRSILATVPATREAALAAIIETDVARWGEGERTPSLHAHAKYSYGRLLSELATRAAFWAEADELEAPLRAAARKVLTPADWRELRQGG